MPFSHYHLVGGLDVSHGRHLHTKNEDAIKFSCTRCCDEPLIRAYNILWFWELPMNMIFIENLTPIGVIQPAGERRQAALLCF